MNKLIKNEDLLTALKTRYATKAFDPTKKVSEADWKTLEATLVNSPSSFGLQPWKFIVVTSDAVKAQLPAASWGQTQVKDASHVVVFTGRKTLDAAYVDKFLARTAEVRNTTVDSLAAYRGFIMGSVEKTQGQHLAWNSRQAYIAAGFLMLAAAELGLDACPMEGIDGAAYDKILGLEGTDYTTLCVVPVGYRSPDDKYGSLPKVRFETKDVVEYR
ncbi:MAG: NAD(P)H-dependent oxidoreductase [Tepidisphaeraceae bacterium]